jgi:hypothetical protein
VITTDEAADHAALSAHRRAWPADELRLAMSSALARAVSSATPPTSARLAGRLFSRRHAL